MPGSVDCVRIDLAGLDQVLDLGDGDSAGHGGERVEVAGRRVVDEVAVPVALRRADQREVGDDAALQDVAPTSVELALPPSAGEATATEPSAA